MFSTFTIMLFFEYKGHNKSSVTLNIVTNVIYYISAGLFLASIKFNHWIFVDSALIVVFIGTIFMISTTFYLFSEKVPFKVFISFALISIVLAYIFPVLFKIPQLKYYILFGGDIALYMLGFVYFTIVAYSTLNNTYFALIFIMIGLIISMTFVRFTALAENFFIYVVLYASLILVWNFSMLIKRNSLYNQKLEKHGEELSKIHEDITVLNNVYLCNSKVKSIESLYENIFEIIKNRFYIKNATIYISEDGEELKKVYTKGFVGDSNRVIDGFLDKKLFQYKSFTDYTVEEIYVGNLKRGEYKSFILKNGLIGIASFPLFLNHKNLGAIVVGINSRCTIIKSDRETFFNLCRHIAVAIYHTMEHRRSSTYQDELKTLASTDYLTGIYNRREFFKQFRKEYKSTIRHNDMFTLFMIDIDDFKKVNDTYGHEVGDIVLTTLSSVVKHHLRSADLFARYGGEEFIGVMLRSEIEGAKKKLEFIMDKIREIRITGYPQIKITVSIGAISYKKEYENIETIIKKADIELYKSKKAGKNMISIK